MMHGARTVLACALALALPAWAAPDCASPTTQADMTTCAHEEFLAASARYASRYAALSKGLPQLQRDRLRRAQKAWLAYRTAACDFESGAAAGGSVREMLRWQCAARFTDARAAELATLATCEEGDVACAKR